MFLKFKSFKLQQASVETLVIGNFNLPVLDDDAISFADPAYTISKIKENLYDPKILEDIQKKLKEDLPVPIPEKAVLSADKKLDSK